MKRSVLTNKIIGILAFSLFFSGVWFWKDYQCAVHAPIIIGGSVTVEIEKGDSFSQITDKLSAKNIAIRPFWFKVLAAQGGAIKKIKTGEYELDTGLTMPGILALFVLGKTKQYSITFPEGWNIRQILKKIDNNPNLQHTLQTVDTVALMATLGADAKHPEGEFFPDTYFFEKHTTDVALLKRAHAKMQSLMQREWPKRDENLPFKTPYEALILASIVEKETAATAERPMIAGVFVRRLKQDMPLQTDPTVIYGMGDGYSGDITAKDLTTDTPYNTYRFKGLPPTPIAMPGFAAITAVLHPGQGDALYFVSRGDGTHVFSATLEDHNAAVDNYQRKQ
ncbi:MAG: endolytic transglycosylase MltG [Methylovulum sp.]|nr:endolytic transglycosylase MltG [Methylovulum sp.]